MCRLTKPLPADRAPAGFINEHSPTAYGAQQAQAYRLLCLMCSCISGTLGTLCLMCLNVLRLHQALTTTQTPSIQLGINKPAMTIQLQLVVNRTIPSSISSM